MKHKISGLKKLGLLAILPLMVDFNASAKELDFTAYFGGNSLHPYKNLDKEYGSIEVNQKNNLSGIGIEITKNLEIYLKNCINSFYREATVIGAKYDFYRGDSIYFGGSLFIVDGYPQNDFKFAPGITWIMGLKNKKLARNLNEILRSKIKNVGLEFQIPLDPEFQTPEVLIFGFKYEF